MNAVYKLIFNVSTGTWAVAHEFAAARGKKSRTRLAAAMAVALSLPAGAALAADSPAALQCAVDETVSADGLRCEAISRGMGTMAALDDAYVKANGNLTNAASVATGNAAVAVGSGSQAIANNTVAIGNTAVTNNEGGVAIGTAAQASGYASSSIGANTKATQSYSLAIGGAGNPNRGASSTAENAVAIGVTSQATAANAVALGTGTLADRADTVSVGAGNPNLDNKTFTRQIVNVKAGTQDDDAVTVTQLKGVVAGLGGGAAVAADGSITAPSYSVGGTTVNNVGAAVTNLDTRLQTVNDYVKVGQGQVPENVADNAGRAGNIAIGSNAKSTGVSANSPTIAIGENTISTGAGSVALGTDSKATGSGGVAIGLRSSSTAASAMALGVDSSATEANTVSVGNAIVKRKVVNMAAGVADTDAVNVSQLKPVVAGLGGGAAIDPITGAVTAPTYNFGGNGSFNNVGAALGNLDGRVGSLENSGGAGGPGLVERNATTGEITVANKEVGGDINLRDANGDTRTLTGIKAGTTRTDAVNFGQLTDTATSVAAALGGGSAVDASGKVTAPSYSIGGSDYANVGDAFGAVDTSLTDLDGRVGSVEGDIINVKGDVTNLQGDITNLTNGTVGIVKYDTATGSVNVATDLGGDKVNFAGTDGARTLAGVKDGTLAAGSDEAVNGSQLFATNERVSTAETNITNLDGRVTTNEGDISNLDGRVTSNETTISNIDGRVTTNEGSITALGDRVTVNEGDITTINGRLDGLAEGTAGIVTYDATAGAVNVATDLGGDTVNLAGTDGERTLAGVKAGTLAADSDEAVNGSQLFATNERVSTAETNITNLDGRVTTNEGDISNLDGRVTNTEGSITTIEGNITNLDGRVTTNEGNITNLTQQIGDLASGGAGIVTYDATAGSVNVASVQGGSLVNFAGADGDRVLAGVADGNVAAGSDEAVNGSQLSATNDRVAANETNITNIDGRVTTAEGDITTLNSVVNNLSSGAAGIVTYDAANGVVNVAAAQGGNRVSIAGTDGDRVLAGVADGKVEDGSDEAVNGSQLSATNDRVAANETSITNIDGRVTNAEGDITNLTTQVTNLSSGAAGLVTIDATTGNVQVAAGKGGDVVDMEGTDGKRRVGGVANGIDDGDAVTMAQLRAAGAIDPVSGDVLSVLTYDDSSLAKATLGGTNGTVIGNLGNGLIAAGSREAVNGGQLYQMNADWEAKWGALDGRVGTIEQGIADGSIGGGAGGSGGNDGPVIAPGTGEGSVAIGDGADAGGAGSVAIGEGSSATGDKGVAVGAGSDASGDNSVAIGAGSSADRDNEFSVGSEGNERIVSNVGAGVRPTDAVNVQQMNDRFEAERKYVDDRFHSVDKRFDRMGAMSSAYAGMAINTAGLSGDNRIGAGVGAQNGRTALAVGYQRILGEKKNVSVSLGGAFSGSDKSVSAGAGYSW